jgi:ElaB/YqjD/DUF883 family membrane-anchored ribosome-binding protein
MAETADMAPGRGTSTGTPRRSASSNGTTRRRAAASAAEDAVQEQSLEAQVAQLQSDLKSITQTLTRMGESKVGEVRSTAKLRAQELADRGQSALDAAEDEFNAIEKQIKDTIREKPLTAVAGAIALGFLIAVITR